MPVKLSSDELVNLSNFMQSRSSEMDGIIKVMQTKVKSMESWNDQQAKNFADLAMSISNQLRLHAENFDKMGKYLKEYAQKIADAEREQTKRVNNIRQ